MGVGLNQNGSSQIDSRARRTIVHLLQRTRLKRPAKALVQCLIRLGVPIIKPRIVRVLPHDTAAFTQGLAYRDGILYESTGGTNSSSLRQLDARDGKLLRLVPVENDFAEGIAILGSSLYQLSWKSGVARIYRVPELQKVGEVRYEGEGWGLAPAVDGLIMTNGTDVVSVLDEQFVVRRHIVVRSRRIRIRRLNDIERVRNRLYANWYGTNEILEVCWLTGRVIRIIDGEALYDAAGPINPSSIMNGIAYDSDRDVFFATGKNWNSIFEFRLPGTAAS